VPRVPDPAALRERHRPGRGGLARPSRSAGRPRPGWPSPTASPPSACSLRASRTSFNLAARHGARLRGGIQRLRSGARERGRGGGVGRVEESATVAREQLLRCRGITQHFPAALAGQGSPGDLADLGPTLAAVAQLLEPTARAHSVAVQVDPVEGPLRVRVNEAELQQVLLNLSLNAVQACQKGGRVVLGASGTIPSASALWTTGAASRRRSRGGSSSRSSAPGLGGRGSDSSCPWTSSGAGAATSRSGARQGRDPPSRWCCRRGTRHASAGDQ